MTPLLPPNSFVTLLLLPNFSADVNALRGVTRWPCTLILIASFEQSRLFISKWQTPFCEPRDRLSKPWQHTSTQFFLVTCLVLKSGSEVLGRGAQALLILCLFLLWWPQNLYKMAAYKCLWLDLHLTLEGFGGLEVFLGFSSNNMVCKILILVWAVQGLWNTLSS